MCAQSASLSTVRLAIERLTEPESTANLAILATPFRIRCANTRHLLPPEGFLTVQGRQKTVAKIEPATHG
jgi:hypothetical protein